MLDQFARNMFRGSAKSFAGDAKARALSNAALEAGFDAGMSESEKQFLYMPFMHSEHILDQRLSLALFARLGRSLSFARSHHAMIARFGRFPHRNEVIGRESSAEELEFLKEAHSSF